MAPDSFSYYTTGADAAGLVPVDSELVMLKAGLPDEIVSTAQSAQKQRVLQ